jgi:acetyl-CoA carboxylase biotin carboxyl carrier protein
VPFLGQILNAITEPEVPQKLVAKPPFAVILNTYLVKREAYLVEKRDTNLLRKDAAMAENKDSDLQKIKELIEIMKRNELVELEISHGDDKIFLKRGQDQPAVGGNGTDAVMAGANVSTAPVGPNAAQSSTPQVPSPVSEPQLEEDLVEITSPLVGTFYATPSPDSDSYVEVGSYVEAQAVVCIIEAMKVMNEIKTETSGTIVEILVANGQAVEYGQVLFRIRPD